MGKGKRYAHSVESYDEDDERVQQSHENANYGELWHEYQSVKFKALWGQPGSIELPPYNFEMGRHLASIFDILEDE